MHPLSVVSFAIFVAGYITARWDLVTRLYELAIFAWDHGVVRSELPGVVVGWRNSPLDVFVVAVLDHVDYLRGVGADNNECADLFKSYQKCLTVAIKERGIDKLVEESREDNRENDAAYLGRKCRLYLHGKGV
ncbi:hypothetical protein BN1723_011344 [Verticillium longisporum]|uniref:Uncharacterized protein n=1 Tax=Verticillium longisporum TaxID=100787 RepID=A0A0G4L6G7_VERLO|nr:hypothetical protein BN1723_011344 [Verticillium longisporum]